MQIRNREAGQNTKRPVFGLQLRISTVIPEKEIAGRAGIAGEGDICRSPFGPRQLQSYFLPLAVGLTGLAAGLMPVADLAAGFEEVFFIQGSPKMHHPS